MANFYVSFCLHDQTNVNINPAILVSINKLLSAVRRLSSCNGVGEEHDSIPFIFVLVHKSTSVNSSGK